MFRLILALVGGLVIAGLGISGWISNGWTTGLSVIVGAVSAVIAHSQAVILKVALFAVALFSICIVFLQYFDDYTVHLEEGLLAYSKASDACGRGDAVECDENTKILLCKYMESKQDLMRAATSAYINTNVPKEISGVIDMNAQRSINILPFGCQSMR